MTPWMSIEGWARGDLLPSVFDRADWHDSTGIVITRVAKEEER